MIFLQMKRSKERHKKRKFYLPVDVFDNSDYNILLSVLNDYF